MKAGWLPRAPTIEESFDFRVDPTRGGIHPPLKTQTMHGPLSTLISYLLGSIPFGYLIVRWRKGIDVRTTGSRSIGATNVMRNLGITGFLSTFVLDFSKGAGAILLTDQLTNRDPNWVAAAAVAAVAGHCFPVWLKFRGGKGVATAVGVFVVLAPVQVGIALVVFVLVVAAWRYISLGSIIAVGVFPALLYLMKHPPLQVVAGSLMAAVIIIAKHGSNIQRLLRGVENRLGRKTASGPE